MGDSVSTTSTSERFNAADADITFESCDHVLFRVHSVNLRCTSESFAPPDGTSTSNEIVALPENAQVLDLVFQHMYPQRQPDLLQLDFEVIAAVAEAVEKYQVYPAMQLCRMHMQPHFASHPVDVLAYAARHDYPTIANQAAQELVWIWSPGTALDDQLSGKPDVKAVWDRYYRQWSDVIRFAIVFPSRVETISEHGDDHGLRIARTLFRLGRGPAVLKDMEKVFDNITRISACGTCQIHGWRLDVQTMIANVKPFNTYL